MESSRSLSDTGLYSDVQSVQKLKSGQQANTPAGLEKVAKAFESIYLKMMLDSMRAAEKIWAEDNPFSSQETQFFQDMLDGQLTKDLSNQKSIGLADMLIQQLSPYVQSDKASIGKISESISNRVSDNVVNKIPENTLNTFNYEESVAQAVHRPHVSPSEIVAKHQFDSTSAASLKESIHSPEQFVQTLMPLAQAAGKKLGIDPKVLIAQAALETGWGQSLQASTTNNLFGIKPGKQWQGDQQSLPTYEFEQGEFKKQTHAFRSYENIDKSFDDYVQFIQQSPRYQNALNASTPAEYVQQLQDNGYATDPGYARKIMSIYDSSYIQNMNPG